MSSRGPLPLPEYDARFAEALTMDRPAAGQPGDGAVRHSPARHSPARHSPARHSPVSCGSISHFGALRGAA